MELHNLLSDQEFAARKLHSHTSKSGLDAMRRLALVFADGQETILQSLVDAARAAVRTFRALGGGWDVRSNPSIAAVK